MTDQGAHVPTAQENAIYEDLMAGDHDDIEAMQAAAYAADQTPPDPTPDGWLSPAEQFDQDYSYGWQRYQAEHEPPQAERELNTYVIVEGENAS